MSERLIWINKLEQSKESRAAYIQAKLSVLVPAQIKSLRLKSEDMPRQHDLARASGLHQSRISMFETPGVSNFTLETLIKLASAFRVGLIVKFVPFSEMLRWENDFSPETFDVIRLDQDQAFTNPVLQQTSPGLAELPAERTAFATQGFAENTETAQLDGWSYWPTAVGEISQPRMNVGGMR